VLLAKLDKQIGADPATSVDAVAETVADLLALLPNAPPSDAKLVLALPAHYATRAREAEAAGRFDEANRFAALGGTLGDVLKGMVPEDGAAREVPQWPKAEPPATDSGSPAIAAAPALPPGDPVSEDDASVVTSIVALLAKLDRQIEEDRPASVQNDLVAETVAHLLTLLPSAAPTDAELVFALPAHFAKRAREAEAGGRQSEANRFAAVGSVLESLLKPKDTTGPRAPMQPKAERSTVVASANLSIAATPDQPSAELAGRAHDRSGVAVEPKPSTAKVAPPRTMEEPSNPAKNRPAESDGRKPPQTPELRLALRDMPSGADARPPLGEILISPERVVSPRAVAKMATAPAAPPPRVAVPASTRGAKSTANAVDPRCRAIVLKFEIGEEPSDAERTYLRHGCRQHG
jgi:hypothetical protein